MLVSKKGIKEEGNQGHHETSLKESYIRWGLHLQVITESKY